MLVEREATHRAIAYAELVDVPILVVHVSGREAVEQIRWAQGHGLRIYAETSATNRCGATPSSSARLAAVPSCPARLPTPARPKHREEAA